MKRIHAGFDYDKMPKKELIKHVEAYAEALHRVSHQCQKLILRQYLIEKHREYFNEIAA